MVRFLSTLCLFSLASTAFGANIAFDTFDDMNILDNSPARWSAIRGAQPDLSSGDLVFSASECCNGVVYFRPISGDVSIRTQARVDSGQFGIAAKFDFLNDGYFVYVNPGGLLSAYTTVNNVESPSVSTSVTPAAGSGKDFILQMDAIADTLSAWYWEAGGPRPTSPQLSLPLQQTIQSGAAGVFLGMMSGTTSSATFRYIQIADAPIPIPEPSSIALAISALGLVCLFRAAVAAVHRFGSVPSETTHSGAMIEA